MQDTVNHVISGQAVLTLTSVELKGSIHTSTTGSLLYSLSRSRTTGSPIAPKASPKNRYTVSDRVTRLITDLDLLLTALTLSDLNNDITPVCYCMFEDILTCLCLCL